MDTNIFINAIIKANCALELKRDIVGVRFLFTKEEFENSLATQPKNKMPYCKMVFNASIGK